MGGVTFLGVNMIVIHAIKNGGSNERDIRVTIETTDEDPHTVADYGRALHELPTLLRDLVSDGILRKAEDGVYHRCITYRDGF